MTKSDRLGQVISDLKTCVRAHAPTAQAAGVHTASDAINFFGKTCGPPLNDLDPAKIGVLPPGMLRIAIGEEWNAFIQATPAR
jgi:hypothetical protein